MAEKQYYISFRSIKQIPVENYYEAECGTTPYLSRTIPLHAVTEGVVLWKRVVIQSTTAHLHSETILQC